MAKISKRGLRELAKAVKDLDPDGRLVHLGLWPPFFIVAAQLGGEAIGREFYFSWLYGEKGLVENLTVLFLVVAVVTAVAAFRQRKQYGVRIIIGKGGLGDESLKAFADLGGVYLAIIGGTAALETTWIETIEDVDLDDLNPESLWKFRIRDFGPLRVAMDSHGGSLYDTVRRDAAGRRAAALAAMGVRG